MMKRLLLLLSFITQFAFAQDPSFDLYPYNTKTINPGLVGLENEQSFDFQFRSDLKDTNSGSSGLISYGGKINKINSGIGLIVLSDRINSGIGGSYTQTKASVLYNYQIKIGENGKLSVGTELKHLNERIETLGYAYYTPSGDLVIQEANSSSSSNFDFDLGVAYQIKKLCIGLASKNVLQSQRENRATYSPKYTTRFYNVYVLNDFTLTKWLKISPSLLFTTNLDGTSILDLNACIELKKLILIGTTQRFYENGSQGAFNIGASFKNRVQIILSVMKSYDKDYKYDDIFELMTRFKLRHE